MHAAAIRDKMDKPVPRNGAITPLKAGETVPADRAGYVPDPRLAELVRLLARRAARQWHQKMLREHGQVRS